MPVVQQLQEKTSGFWSLVRQSLRGEQVDFTTANLNRAVILLAIPMMLEMIMESVFAVVDIYFVSHLGKHATSTVGLTESVLMLVYSLAIGISMAATAVVARRVGEKDEEGANKAGMQAILLAVALTVMISIAGVWFAPSILRMMGAEAETVQIGKGYTRIVMGGSVFIMLLYLINGIFRGAGDAMMAMKSLWLANICNIILCPLLIRGWGPIPAYGLEGAALATTIGRGIGVCYQLFHLIRGNSIIHVRKSHLMPDMTVLRNLISIAWPATFQFLIGSGSWILLASLVVQTGFSEASAGYQIGIRIIMFFLLPAWGMSNAAATLVGQNLGAANPDRAEASVWLTVKYNAIFMGSVCLIFLLFAEFIVSFFTADAAVARHAILAMRVISAGYIFYGIGMVLINAFNGAGDTRTPTVINLICFWLFQVPMAWILAKTLGMGPLGVYLAIPIAETAITIAAFFVFRKGRWKTVKV